MHSAPIVFQHTGLTVRATPSGESWRGELLDEHGDVKDEFSYTREAFPGGPADRWVSLTPGSGKTP